MRALSCLWAFPCSALGWFLARVGGCSLARRGQVLEFIASPSRGPWAWWFRRSGVAAVTIGESVIYRDRLSLLDGRLAAHERRHAEQYRRLGVLFFPAYVSCALLAKVMGRDPYRENWLELDAQLSGNEGGG